MLYKNLRSSLGPSLCTFETLSNFTPPVFHLLSSLCTEPDIKMITDLIDYKLRNNICATREGQFWEKLMKRY